MRIDVFGDLASVDDAVGGARRAAAAGVHTFWLPQIQRIAPLVALSVVAREVPDIHIGTSVVSMPSIHPTLLAQEALTVGQVADGRFTLGIGLSHKSVVEGNFGLPWRPPIRYMNEYLDVLLPLLERGSVAAQGSLVSGHWDLEMPVSPVPVILAALGPQMLGVAGKRTSGTTTWMVGPRTIAEHTVPAISTAAAGAGRPEPLIAAGYPVCVTEAPDDARARAAQAYEIYGTFPSYRAMLDREGAAGPEDLAIIGGAGFVAERLAEIDRAGATAIVVDFFGRRPEQEATWELVAELASA